MGCGDAYGRPEPPKRGFFVAFGGRNPSAALTRKAPEATLPLPCVRGGTMTGVTLLSIWVYEDFDRLNPVEIQVSVRNSRHARKDSDPDGGL